MRKIAVLTISMLLLATAAWAAPKAVKIGILDMQKVIEKSEPGQQAFKELEAKFQKMKSDLDAQKKELEALREEIQRQSIAISQEAKQTKELEFKRKVRDFQDTYQAYQRQMKMEQEKISKPILEMLVEVVESFGKKNGYTMIIDKRRSGLLYGDDAAEITNDVMVELNRVWRAKAKK